ncbi:MAG: hypothetical protein CMG71_07325 [Candidatus Marinimicrobia bacterium]|nr:hypothetical protein [Candidatus Neomarinimicrobiota bacterium]|tara:strand:+ start:5026 stop:5430 length:405 start_codon:yes stop_codon:yes gene_type:complete
MRFLLISFIHLCTVLNGMNTDLLMGLDEKIEKGMVGNYTHEAYGTVEVSRVRRQLMMKHWGSSLKGDLDHWQNNNYRITWNDSTVKDDSARIFINFQIDSQARIKSLSVELLIDFDEKNGPQSQEIVFKKAKSE